MAVVRILMDTIPTPNKVLTAAERIAIRKKWNLKLKHQLSLRALGHKYGVSHEQIRLIVTGVAPARNPHYTQIINDYTVSKRHSTSIPKLSKEFGVKPSAIDGIVEGHIHYGDTRWIKQHTSEAN